LIVVPVKVGVDDEFHGLGSEFLDLLDEGAGGGGLGVGVDDEHAVAEDDDGGVAIYFVGGLGDGGINTVGDGLDVEEVVGREAGGWEQE
jgi:hypothetical protein